jgi:hypothetical protein
MVTSRSYDFADQVVTLRSFNVGDLFCGGEVMRDEQRQAEG